jgi:hypothetical protein
MSPHLVRCPTCEFSFIASSLDVARVVMEAHVLVHGHRVELQPLADEAPEEGTA